MATAKERVWLTRYLTHFNATQAAREADYAWPNKIGPTKKQKFAEEIAAHLANLAMERDEALARLSMIGRGSMEHFLKFEGEEPGEEQPDDEDNPENQPAGEPRLSLAKARQRQALALVRDYTETEIVIDRDGNDVILKRERSVKLYDAQRAITDILKAHPAGTVDDPIHHTHQHEHKNADTMADLADLASQASDELAAWQQAHRPAGSPGSRPS